MKLSEEQNCVLETVWKGYNVFMTGSGGTGKTTLIREIHRQAAERNKNIQVAALTGCAAVLLACKARTIHSFAGIGLGTGTIEENVEKVSKNYMRSKSWRQLDILVVDEVSMMSKKLFEMLDAIARKVRRSDRPFGGLQIIFSGDFYQIRPIGNDPETSAFCFESPLWDKVFGEHQIILKRIFRQKDPIYANVLNQIREGELDDEIIEMMNKRIDVPIDSGVLRPTRLFPKRRQVDEINLRELNRLSPDTEQVFKMKDETDLPMTKKEAEIRRRFSPQDIQNELMSLRRNLMCDPVIHLRAGSQVMCIVNKEYDEDLYLCNGSQGIVKDFTPSGLPIVDFSGREVIVEPNIWPSEVVPGVGISQIPLILAWAMTIHKAQGATLDMAEIDAGDAIFECGQTYVALSRIKNLSGLYLTSFDPKSIYINPKVKEFYDHLRQFPINKN